MATPVIIGSSRSTYTRVACMVCEEKGIAPGTADGKPDRAAIRAVMPAVHEQLGVLDKAVAGSGHLVGDQFIFADINLMPILHRVQQAPEAHRRSPPQRILPPTTTGTQRDRASSGPIRPPVRRAVQSRVSA